MPCMAYTHCQPAQPTTVGKRATLWANELVMDLQEIDHRLAVLQLRGVKGTTGTQASFTCLWKIKDSIIFNGIAYDGRCVIICNPVLVIVGRLQTLDHKVDQSGKKDGIFFGKSFFLIKDRSILLTIQFLF